MSEQLIERWVHEELVNWARWCWSGSWPHPVRPGRAASAEGRFVAPSDLGDESGEPHIRPHSGRARIVQRVYERQLTERQRRVLASEYPRRHLSGRVRYGRAGAARKLHLSTAMYETALRQAARQVQEAFECGFAIRAA